MSKTLHRDDILEYSQYWGACKYGLRWLKSQPKKATLRQLAAKAPFEFFRWVFMEVDRGLYVSWLNEAEYVSLNEDELRKMVDINLIQKKMWEQLKRNRREKRIRTSK